MHFKIMDEIYIMADGNIVQYFIFHSAPLQFSLPKPVRYALQPWAEANECARSSLLQQLSNSAACHLLPTAAVAPGPSTSSRPNRDIVWHRTVKIPSRRLSPAMASDLSPSSDLMCPLLPLVTPATLTRHVARAATNACVASDTSPKFPDTMP